MYKLANDFDGILLDSAYVPNCPGNVDWDTYQVWLSEGNSPEPADPIIPAIPQTVTATQGGIALIQAGLMNGVQAVVDATETPPEVKWAWSRSQTWERDSDALGYLAQKAGLTDKQMDDLFIAAAQIQA